MRLTQRAQRRNAGGHAEVWCAQRATSLAKMSAPEPEPEHHVAAAAQRERAARLREENASRERGTSYTSFTSQIAAAKETQAQADALQASADARFSDSRSSAVADGEAGAARPEWVPRKAPLAHPTVEDQQAALSRIMACVTEASVRKLCAHVGLEFVSFEFLPEGEPGCTFGQYEGCQARPFNVNPNWVITAHRPGSAVDDVGSPTGEARSPARLPSTESLGLSKSVDGSGTYSIDEFGDDEMILQVTNSHSWGTRSVTHSKVGAMQWLRSNGVPLIPPVIAWSADPASSPIGCEYLLMERANGIELRKIWDTLTSPQKNNYSRQLAEWLRAVGTVPRPLPAEGYPNAVTGFRVQRGTTKRLASAVGRSSPRWEWQVHSNTPWVSNAPAFPLCEGYAAYAANTVHDAISRVEREAGKGGEGGAGSGSGFVSGFGDASRVSPQAIYLCV